MKKILLLAFAISFSLVTEAQTAKWFVTFSTGFQIAGPSSSLKKYMNDNGFNVSSQTFLGPADYPTTTPGLAFLAMLGGQVGKNRSLYILLGMPWNGEVSGFDGHQSNNVKYHVYQFGGGYQFSSSNSRSSVGAGPSLFILQSGKNNHTYGNNELTEKHTAVKPGLTITGRTALGKGRKLLGLELFAELNVAPKASFVDPQSYDGKTSYNMNMTGGMLGLALAVSKR